MYNQFKLDKFLILKYVFISLLLILCVIIGTNLHANPQVALITASRYVGDREVAWRMKIAGERLGWKVIVDEDEGRNLKGQKFDWVICMLPKLKPIKIDCPNYLMVFHPFNYLNDKRMFNSISEKFDGYLLTIHDRETLRKGLKRKNKKFHHISFNPTVYNVPYKKLAAKDLVVMIPVWGNRLTDPKFCTLYQLLNKSGFAKFYGPKSNSNIDPQNYMGAIPFDGTSVIDVLQQHGVVLVFHSDIHNEESIPSARIFEAAASSTVIICDENPFVRKHFGDAVFYIDTTQSGKSIFNQIEKHMQTIAKDPEKALEMARKAHEIFSDKFTMEHQLLQLQEMHKEVLKDKGLVRLAIKLEA